MYTEDSLYCLERRGTELFLKQEIFIIQGIHKRMVRFQLNWKFKPHHSFVYTLYYVTVSRSRYKTFVCVLHTEYKQLQTYTWNGSL